MPEVERDRRGAPSAPYGIGRWLSRLAALLVAALAAGDVGADGGVVRLKETRGAFTVTVFSPEPVEAGPVDLSVLVQGGDAEVSTDAAVDLVLQPPDPTRPPIARRASREAATNRLLRAAVVELDEPGEWRLEVRVRRGDETATFVGALAVGPPRSRLLRLWPQLALPLVAVLLFAGGQWLAARREMSRRGASGRSAPMPPVLVLLVCLAAAGCDPVINFYGSFFPAWAVCLVAGVIVAVLGRYALAALRLEDHLGPLVVVYPSLAFLVSCAVWLVFFRS